MTRAALAVVAVIISSIMYLPNAESAVPPSHMVGARFEACTGFPADSLWPAKPEFHKASVDFRISK